MRTVAVRNIDRADEDHIAILESHSMREPLAKAGLIYVDSRNDLDG